MKRNFFHIVLKYTVWNTRFQSFRCLGLKLTILTSLQSCATLISKMGFELRGQNTTWQEPLTSFGCQNINSVWRKVRREKDNEADIALLVPPASEVSEASEVPQRSCCERQIGSIRPQYTSLCSRHIIFEELCCEKNLAVLSSMEAQGLKMN